MKLLIAAFGLALFVKVCGHSILVRALNRYAPLSVESELGQTRTLEVSLKFPTHKLPLALCSRAPPQMGFLNIGTVDIGGCSVHCGLYSSFPALCLLVVVAKPISCVRQKCSKDCQMSPRW